MRRILFTLSLIALAPLGAGATTYVMLPDEALVDQAALVAQVSVMAAEPAPIAGPPATDYFVQVERVLKGYVPGSTLVVRVLGGIAPDGLGLRIWGMPEFREGERALLFLEPRRDGTYGILHLMLGAFYEVEWRGRRVATRSLTEAVELTPAAIEGASIFEEPLRDFDRFVRWISDRAVKVRRPIDYLLPPPDTVLRAAGDSSRLLEDRCTQLNYRWSEFDRGESVTWSLDGQGQGGAPGGALALGRALKLWDRAPDLPIHLARGGRLRAESGLAEFDGVNTLLLNDPNRNLAGAFRCTAGGVVSVSGLWFENGRGQSCERLTPGRKVDVDGRSFLEILGAEVVTNNGSACLFAGDPEMTYQVLVHEVGHSLGLAHSGTPASAMSGEIREGGWDGELLEEDLEALRKLYGER